MKFVFRIMLASNTETRNGFFAETEEQARALAVEWAGEGAEVGECVERWHVNGWSNGQAEYGGVYVGEFFEPDGTYRGPDQDGVYPIFELVE